MSYPMKRSNYCTFMLGKEQIHKELMHFVNAFCSLPGSNLFAFLCLGFSQSHRLEGTSRTIWSNISLQKHALEKMAQHPLQPNLKSIHCWEITTALRTLFQWPVVLIVQSLKTLNFCVQLKSPQGLLVHITSPLCDSL